MLAAILILIMNRTTKLFDLVFQKYDDLNASVQENVTAIRVVKAFVREEYENSKFIKAAQNLYRLFVKAEGILVLEDGRINGFDTHENLMKTNEIYRDIYETQVQGSGDFDHAVPEETTGKAVQNNG